MTQTTSRSSSGNITLNPRLAELLQAGRLDWDDPRHRAAYLEYWVSRPVPQEEEN